MKTACIWLMALLASVSSALVRSYSVEPRTASESGETGDASPISFHNRVKSRPRGTARGQRHLPLPAGRARLPQRQEGGADAIRRKLAEYRAAGQASPSRWKTGTIKHEC